MKISTPNQKLPLYQRVELFAKKFLFSSNQFNIYPEAHPSLKPIILDLKNSIDALIENKDDITFLIEKEKIVIGGEGFTSSKVDIIKRFTETMHIREIGSFSIKTGFSTEELERFVKVVSLDPLQIRASGGIEKLLHEADIGGGIKIVRIDYRKILYLLNIRAKELILRYLGDMERFKGSAIYRLIMGETDELYGEEYELITLVPEVDSVIKRLLNLAIEAEKWGGVELKVKFISIICVRLKNYLLKHMLWNLNKFEMRLASAVSALEETLLNSLMRLSLNGSDSEKALIKEILALLPGVNAARFFVSLILEDGIISTDTASLISYRLRQKGGEKKFADMIGAVLEEKGCSGDMILGWETVERVLLSAKENESFLPYLYKIRLEELGRITPNSVKTSYINKSRLSAFFSAESLGLQKCFLLKANLKLKDDIEGYKHTLLFIHAGIVDFCSSKKYELIAELLSSIRDECKSTGEFGVSAKEVFEKISFKISKEILSDMRNMLSPEDIAYVVSIADIIAAENLLLPLIGLLKTEKDISVRRGIVDILSKSGGRVLPEIRGLLYDGQWNVVRNGITILSALKDKSLCLEFKRLLTHPVPQVGREMIRDIPVFSDDDAVSIFKEALFDKDERVMKGAVTVIGRLPDKKMVEGIFVSVLKDCVSKNISYPLFEQITVELERINPPLLIEEMEYILNNIKTAFWGEKAKIRRKAEEVLKKLGS